MKKITSLLSAIFILTGFMSIAQVSDTLFPVEDAIIRMISEQGDSSNYGNYEYINMHAWTHEGQYVIHRSLIKFDLSSIPDSSIISNAILYLYSDLNSTEYPDGHQPISGTNECSLYKIVSDWDEYSVTWNNQPLTTDIGHTELPASDSCTQNYQVDLTTIVQDMVNNPSANFGFMIRLQNEMYYRRMVFASRDNQDESIHPRLIVLYQNTSDINCHTKKSNIIVYPNPAHNYISISFIEENSMEITLKLFDSKGIMVRNGKYNSTDKICLDIGNMSAGIYTLFLSNQNNSYELKKIIIR